MYKPTFPGDKCWWFSYQVQKIVLRIVWSCIQTIESFVNTSVAPFTNMD